jgi:hypothetical protein
MSEPGKGHALTRRDFTVGAAVAAAVSLLPDTAAAQQPDAITRLSPGARAEVEMKVNEIFRKYGKRLTDAQKADIRKVVAETQEGLEKMRSFALTNADQPATVLALYEPTGRHNNAQ